MYCLFVFCFIHYNSVRVLFFQSCPLFFCLVNSYSALSFCFCCSCCCCFFFPNRSVCPSSVPLIFDYIQSTFVSSCLSLFLSYLSLFMFCLASSCTILLIFCLLVFCPVYFVLFQCLELFCMSCPFFIYHVYFCIYIFVLSCLFSL